MQKSWEKEGRDLRSIGENLEISLKPRTRYYLYVEVTGEDAESARSEVFYFETGKMQEGFPGWMHCINLGATTVWERWYSVLDDGSISGTYVSNWHINNGGTVTVHFEVTFNCTATAVLPGTGGEEVELEAGVFERTYQPKRDLPIAYGLIMSQDAENLSLSLAEMQFMFLMGFDPPMVQKAAEQILLLDARWCG